MEASKYRRLLKEGDPTLDLNFGGVMGMQNALKKIKLISDLEEKKKEAEKVWRIHDIWHPRHLTVDPPSEVKPLESCGLYEYDNLLSELRTISKEGIKKPKPNNPVPPPEKPKSREEPQPQQEDEQVECFFCEQCYKEIKVGAKYYHKKGASEKFCSKDCFLIRYGEFCHKCNNRFLTIYQHWDKKNYPDAFYCFTCYDLAKKEWQEEEEREERLFNRDCKYCFNKTNSMFDVCNKQECLDKMNEEIERKHNNKNDPIDNNPNKDNPNQRERERERAKLQFDISELTNKPNKTAEEEDKLTKLKTKLKELEDESKKPNNQPTNQSESPTNYLPLIIVSVVVVIGLFLILFLITRKKKHHKYK